MSKHINFIYAADENYNKQLLISINSLLEQFSGIANIHIIHKNPSSFIQKLQEIDSFDKLDQLNIYKFKESKVLFPNIEGTHISEATYYRLFVDKYIPNDVTEYVYLDADIICLSDPYDYLKSNIDILLNSSFSFSARTEIIRDNNKDKFLQLGLSGDKYFNAGVLIVNHTDWLTKNVYSELIKHIDIIKNDIEFWDQDVLNSYFNGEYLEMDNKLNYGLDLFNNELDNNIIKKNSIFLHYQGSNKPWDIVGSTMESSKFYNHQHYKLFGNNYHVVSKYKRGDLLKLIKIIFTLKIFKIKNPFGFISSCIRSLT